MSDADGVYLYGKLDGNVIPLIDALNQLPGIKTFASCGGHIRPSRTQQPRGKWFVSFRASDLSSLQMLVKALLLEGGHTVRLEIDGLHHDCILSGDCGISPSVVVGLIRKVIE